MNNVLLYKNYYKENFAECMVEKYNLSQYGIQCSRSAIDCDLAIIRNEILKWVGNTEQLQQCNLMYEFTDLSTWTIAHDLGFTPSIIVTDLNGNVLLGTITTNNTTSTVITFLANKSGFVYLT